MTEPIQSRTEDPGRAALEALRMLEITTGSSDDLLRSAALRARMALSVALSVIHPELDLPERT